MLLRDFFILFILVLFFATCGGSGNDDLNINRVLEPGLREMTDEELIWWQETIDCLKQEGIIYQDCFPPEPRIFIVDGNNIPISICTRNLAGCAAMEGLEIVIISEVGVHYEQLIKHESHHTTLFRCNGSYDGHHLGRMWDGRCGAYPTLNTMGIGDFFREIEFGTSDH